MRLEVVDDLVVEAIMEGVKAGVFRRAQRLNRSAAVWGELADKHSRRVAALLAQALTPPEGEASGRRRAR